MTIKELIEQLKTFDQNLKVIMSKDGEGNNYSPLDDIGIGVYTPECTWSGDFYPKPDADDVESREEYAQLLDENGAVASICFWPVN